MSEKRRDNKGRIIHNGEFQMKDGRYRYKYFDSLGKEKVVYSWKPDISVTLNVYTHVKYEDAKEEVYRLAKVV